MMGAGKTAIGRRLAKALGWPFKDADAAIEAAAGTTHRQHLRRDRRAGVPRQGAPGDRPPADTASAWSWRSAAARSWIRRPARWCRETGALDLAAGRARRAGQAHRAAGQAAAAARRAIRARRSRRLLAQRAPIYAQADLVVDSGKGPISAVVAEVLAALAGRAGRARAMTGVERLTVELGARSYEIVVGPGLLRARRRRAAPVLRQPRGDRRHRRAPRRRPRISRRSRRACEAAAIASAPDRAAGRRGEQEHGRSSSGCWTRSWPPASSAAPR